MKIMSGVGTSKCCEDAFEAGKNATGKAVEGLLGKPASLFIVYSTPQFDLIRLLAGIRSVSGETELIGCTTSGEIVNGEHFGFGGGVAVLALSGGPYRFGIASAKNITGRLDQAGQDIARQSKKLAGPSPYAAMLLLVDCLAGDLQEFFHGVYRITGPSVAISGGAASDELRFSKTYVFHNDQVIENGAVGLWIASSRPVPVITRHGWEPIGVPLLVTRAEGTELIELSGKPAAIAFEEQLGLAPGSLAMDKFWDTSILHPFGLLQADGSFIIRVARSKTERNTLMIQGCLPPVGSAVQVMYSSMDVLLNVANEVAETAQTLNPDLGVILCFSCTVRAVIFGKLAGEEAKRLHSVATDVSTFGFFCCGEFARTAGVLGTHNATLTALAL